MSDNNQMINRKRKLSDSEEEEASVKNVLTNAKLLHSNLHGAITMFDINEFKRLLKLKPKICFKNKYVNCYILAQKAVVVNPEFLTVLLEYDSSGINLVDSEGNTLLMKDIRYYKYRHFEMLIDKGADVNISNKEDYTALHYATMNRNTPVNIIKRLLESKADVNKTVKYPIALNEESKKNEDFCAPLHLLLKNFKKSNGLEKVKLLTKAGADLNKASTNSISSKSITPLQLAAEIDMKEIDFNLIKYLIENGAKPALHDTMNKIATVTNILTAQLNCGLRYLHEEEIVSMVKNYYIPTISLLVEAGDDLFKEYGFDSPLCYLFYAYNENEYIYELIIHVAKLAFEILSNGFKLSNEHIHPLCTIVQNLGSFLNDEYLFPEIVNLILHYNSKGICIKSFEYYGDVNSKLTWDCIDKPDSINLNVVSAFILHLPLTEMKEWFIKLKKHNFIFDDDDELLYILFQRFLTSETDNNLLEVVDFLLENSCEVCSTELMFKQDLLKTLQIIYEIPDGLWLCAAAGNVELVKKLLPYWDETPLMVLLFLCPWLETKEKYEELMLKSMEKILPTLIELSEPVRDDTKIFSLIKEYFQNILKEERKNRIGKNSSVETRYKKIADILRKLLYGDSKDDN